MPGIDGAQIYVSEGLGGAGSQLKSMADELIQELQQLKNRLAPLADSWKQSQAATYYQDMQNEWDMAAYGLFDEENGVLGRIANAMNVNIGNYSECEWSNIATWNN